jgi:branched-chain amino acid transport system ATP-binding protein
VPEGRQLFPDLTVEDNLRLGAYRSRDRDPSWVYRLLPELERTRGQRAGTLSGGQQQMVAIGRGLMSRPDVLAIDEMSLGLAPIIVRRLARILTQLNRQHGLAVFLVEQSAHLAFSLCTRGYVLETGAIVASGTTVELAHSPLVKDAYLGSAGRDGDLEGAQEAVL